MRCRSCAAFVGSAVTLCLIFASCARPKNVPPPAVTRSKAASLFAFDRKTIPVVTIDGERSGAGVLIRDGHFPSINAKHGNVKFYLVRPTSDGGYAGILFFHWLGRPKGDREEFLDEAIGLAPTGVVSLLIQGYFPWTEDPRDGTTDRQQVIDQTIDTQRALDLLLREPGVDSLRVAFVGHDYGAMFGSIIAGLETRVKAYVFIAGMGNFGDWSLKYWPATAAGGEELYREALHPVDPVNFVPLAAPASLLFQFATNDKYISRQTAEAFSAAASYPRIVRWYETTHEMATAEVAADRRAWLGQQLGLPPQ